MNGPPDRSLIVAFTSDPLFSTSLKDFAQKHGMQVITFEDADSVILDDLLSTEIQFAEQRNTPDVLLVERISRWLPACLIFDLHNQAVPWHDWIAWLKSSPATRRIPIVCFGMHKDASSFKAARNAGADAVFTRSQFVENFYHIIQQFAHGSDLDELRRFCQEPLSSLAVQGLELFNRGEYFLAHEKLEEAWNEDRTPARNLYRAVIQVAVAYLQIQRKNYDGAYKMFLRLRQWIEPLPEVCRGVDVGRLRKDANEIYEHLVAGGRKQIDQFDQTLFKPVIFRVGS